MKILENVNLSMIKFSIDGRDVSLDFIDMYELKPLSTLMCSHVFFLNTQNSFQDDEGFSCYIGEVRCTVIERSNIAAWFKENNYKFLNQAGDAYVSGATEFNCVHLESGEFMLDLICEDVKFTPGFFGV